MSFVRFKKYQIPVDECSPNPCKQNAACDNELGDFTCFCPPKWSGKTCHEYDPSFYGWDGYSGHGYKIDLAYQREQCTKKGCKMKNHNQKCDEECNTYACDFDGGDCILGVNPWLNCISTSINCWEVFENGVCNDECNNEQCLFDGRDCERSLTLCPDDLYCQTNYANGICNDVCNCVECNWDGLDCETERVPKLAKGMIALVVLVTEEEFRQNSITFLWNMGHQLRTNVKIKKNNFGNDMIHPFNVKDDINEIFVRNATQVYMEIDNSCCISKQAAKCFYAAQNAAAFIGASAHKMSGKFPIYQVRGVDSIVTKIDAQSNYQTIVGAFIVCIMICAFVGVLVAIKRKCARKTWFPYGFQITGGGQRRDQDDQEMGNLNENPIMAYSDNVSDERAVVADKSHTNDNDEKLNRVWSQLYFEAATIRVPASMMTPPSHQEPHDVNARGPCGMTPLMVASMQGVGIDFDFETNEDKSIAQKVLDLVAQGAEIHAAMDETGETALHLAARYARADVTKRLLDSGADANFQDNTGRTALHAAIASDALGVFRILLRNRATNLNARMHDGTTPSILAGRLAIEGMVEDLITAGADINAADNYGKTVLHWAAAVNNVEAVNTLLTHHANRDAQDNKDETPLFLAAREGSLEACKALLDSFALHEIADNMNRTPHDVASERKHKHIVRFLDEHVPRSLQMISQPSVIPASEKQTEHTKPAKRPKQQKATNGNSNDPNSPDKENTTKRGIAKKRLIATSKKSNPQPILR